MLCACVGMPICDAHEGPTIECGEHEQLSFKEDRCYDLQFSRNCCQMDCVASLYGTAGKQLLYTEVVYAVSAGRLVSALSLRQRAAAAAAAARLSILAFVQASERKQHTHPIS
jgi:hypothetical protein